MGAPVAARRPSAPAPPLRRVLPPAMVRLLDGLGDQARARHPRSRPDLYSQPPPEAWPYCWPPPPADADAVAMVAREPLAVPGSAPGLVGRGTLMPGETFLASPASAVLRAVIGQATLAGPPPPWWPPPDELPAALRTPVEFLDATGGIPGMGTPPD